MGNEPWATGTRDHNLLFCCLIIWTDGFNFQEKKTVSGFQRETVNRDGLSTPVKVSYLSLEPGTGLYP